MSLRVCANGHITGYRHCARCGADAGTPVEYTHPVSMNRHERKRQGEALRQAGQLNYDQSRRETRVGGGVAGPNKQANIT